MSEGLVSVCVCFGGGDTTLGLQLFAGSDSLIWRALILAGLQSQLLTPTRFVELCILSSDEELD